MVTINNRDKIPWFKNMTVKDLLQEMGYDFTLITVTVNGELVADEDYGSYIVPDEAHVTAFHLAHGG